MCCADNKIMQLDIQRTRIISIDGPIGVGKTTLGTRICELLGECAMFFPETGHMSPMGKKHPVTLWSENPEKLSVAFQMSMYVNCQSRMKEAALHAVIAALKEETKVIMIDRSLIGNAIFADTNRRMKRIDEIGFEFYEVHLHTEPVLSLSSTDLNVQLWAPIDVCLKRLGIRSSDDTTQEADNYDDSYFFEVARTAFCALLCNLSRPDPHPQLVINWSGDREQTVDLYCDSYNYYFNHKDNLPVTITLSHAPIDEDMPYTHLFDYSHCQTIDAFFSRDVINTVMDTVAHRTPFRDAQRLYIRLPECVQQTSFSKIFPLTIV